MHLSYWKGDLLVTVVLFVCDRLKGGEHLDLVILSRLFASLTHLPAPVSLVGSQLDVIKTIDMHFHPQKGVYSHSPFNCEIIERLLVDPNNLIFGRVDIFSLVEHIVMRLRGATDEEWLHRSSSLIEVSRRSQRFHYVYGLMIFLCRFLFGRYVQLGELTRGGMFTDHFLLSQMYPLMRMGTW